jgi:hypothetical protein
MNVRVRALLGHTKGGVSARAPQVGLVGHGGDETQALEALRASVKAWCEGLYRIGELPTVLARKQVPYEDGDGDITIDLVTR